MFAEARERLSCHIINFGYMESRDDYYRVLSAADVAVSTALHEFFGVAMYVCLILISLINFPNNFLLLLRSFIIQILLFAKSNRAK